MTMRSKEGERDERGGEKGKKRRRKLPTYLSLFFSSLSTIYVCMLTTEQKREREKRTTEYSVFERERGEGERARYKMINWFVYVCIWA